MIRWHQREANAKRGQPALPDGVFFNDLEAAWEIWRMLRWIDWRWPPDVLLNQPWALMEDIATLEWYSGVVKDTMVAGVGSRSAAISS